MLLKVSLMTEGGGGGIDKPDRCYIRRRKREKEGNKQTEAELEV